MFDPSDLQDLADRTGVPVILAQQHAPLLALIAAMTGAHAAGIEREMGLTG